MDTKVSIKPLSVNEAWQGKRFKTNRYKSYESELLWTLPKNVYIPKDKIKLVFTVGYNNPLSDIDNFLKPFIDVLQKKYVFNDSKIYELTVHKQIVKKGTEFIKFTFYDYIDELDN